jgi:hypothetical protein
VFSDALTPEPATIATMSRSKSQARTTREQLQALPWAALLRGGFVVGRRWKALSAKDRARLSHLVRESGGRPVNLGPKQRRELRSLLDKLDLKGMGRELLPLLRGRRGTRRCRRRKSV